MTPGLRIESPNERHFGRWLILLVVAMLLCAAGYYAYQWYTKGNLPPVPMPASALADPTVDETPVSLKAIDEYTVPATQPRYISIPAIGIEKARVMSVGLTVNNILDTPANIADTAWFNKSATPGSGTGAVVIDGHNGGMTKDGIFAKLGKLNTDDEIIIERGDGKKFSYYTTSNVTMTLEEANTTGMQQMMKSSDPSRQGLSLITCAGNWIPRDKVFDKRVMVRAIADE